MFLKKNWRLIIILIVASVVLGLITFVNHYYFRTYALDLGAYTNAAYKYAHLDLASNDVFISEYQPMLGGHFDLYLIFFSPLIYFFGSYTLLIVQWCFILIGGLGVYKLFQNWYSNKTLSLCSIAYFFSFYGVFSAVSFDYHSVVVASSLVPWFFLFIRKNQLITASIVFTFCLFAQENVALGMTFISSGLAFLHRKEKKKALVLLILTGWSICYFLIVLKIVIPFFNPTDSYTGFHYSVMGDDITGFLINLFQNPFQAFKILFINHTNDPFFDGIKKETWLMLSISGGFLLFRKPIYLWMLIPILFQKLYHDSPIMWSVNYQYSIEFAPILTIGIFDVIATIKNLKISSLVSNLAVVLAIVCTIHLMDNTIFMYDKDRLRIYDAKHYQREFPIKKAYKLLELIPKNASVSAQSAFVPHLSCRDKIYQFPIIKDAEFIILSPKDNYYPIDSTQFFYIADSLYHSNLWITLIKDENFIVYRRKTIH